MNVKKFVTDFCTGRVTVPAFDLGFDLLTIVFHMMLPQLYMHKRVMDILYASAFSTFIKKLND